MLKLLWTNKIEDKSWLDGDSQLSKMVSDEAIVVRNVQKKYGNGPAILDGLNMTVARGSIYGLLGASGCGKTTLLTCVVGARKVDSGEIWVLGGKPGSKGSGIPGPRVGYMPQEISLVREFTVLGALYYFGRVNGMDDDVIEEKHAFLSELLQLPPKDYLIKNISGGQQRRVSFAAALLHDPELLILDEPTVGLDPVLRANIWDFLADIARVKGTTVVITTHYVEETRLANRIGFLRCGQLLAEASPNQLVVGFQCESLEDTFLKLSQRQKESQDRGVTNLGFLPDLEQVSIPATNETSTSRESIIDKEKQSGWSRETAMKRPYPKSSAGRRFKALMIKNILQFVRHPGAVLFALVLPLVQTWCFFKAIGGDPMGLHMAVVNNEAGNCNDGRYLGRVVYVPDNYTCDFVDLSCRFLDVFNKDIAENKFYNDEDDARAAVRDGKAVGLIVFNQNFSTALQQRRDDFKDASVDEIVAGEIAVSLDMGDRQVGLYVQKKMAERFFDIYADIVQECDLPRKIGDLPLRLEDPIFGRMDQSYATFVAPAFILSLVFFVATSVASSIIIADRHEGIWDRSLVQGVTTGEILAAHLLTQLMVIVLQVAITLSMSFLMFNLECIGSMFMVTLMVLLIGICGMCYGFLISVLCSSHTLANYMSTGSFYPVILLGGCIWPIEGMPRMLMWLSLLMPTTIPSIAMRALLSKGYTIDDPEVYSGFLVVSGWTASLVALSFFSLRLKAV